MTESPSRFIRITNPYVNNDGAGDFAFGYVSGLARVAILSARDVPEHTVAMMNSSYKSLACSLLQRSENEITAMQALAWEVANAIRDYDTMDLGHKFGPLVISKDCTCPEPHSDMASYANGFMDAARAGDNTKALAVYVEWTTGDTAADGVEKLLAAAGQLDLGGTAYQVAHGRELLLNISMHITEELLRWNEEHQAQQAEAAAMDPAPENV